MPYKSVADSVHANKLCGRLYSSGVHFLTENETANLRFEPPPLFVLGLGATYVVLLRLIGNRVVDFPLSDN